MKERSRSTVAPIRMLLWEIFAQRRGAFLGMSGALVTAVAIATSCHYIPGSKAVIRGILTASGVLLTAFVYALFNFTRLDKKTGQAGFPTRLFTLPLSTLTLVTLPMVTGSVSVAFFFCAWWLLVLRQFGIQSIIAWPALVLSVAMLCFQATLWSLAAFRTARLLVLSLGGTALATFAIVPAFGPGPQTIKSATASLFVPTIVMIAIGIAAYITALITVSRQRHAGGHGAGVRKLIEHARDLNPMRSQPFESASAAQLWFEMRYAILLPLLTLVIMLVVWFMSFCFRPLPAGLTAYTLCIFAIIPSVLGGMIARGIWMPDKDLPTLMLIRPISSGDLIFTKGQATVFASVLAWFILLTVTPAFLVTACDTSLVISIYQKVNEMSFLPAWFLLVLALAFAMLDSWKSMLKPAPLALWSRPIIEGIVTTLYLLAVLTVIIILTNEPRLFLKLGRWLIPWIPPILLLLDAAFIVKLSLAYIWGRKLVTRNLASSEHVRTYCIIWALATCFITLIAFAASAALSSGDLPPLWTPLLAVLIALNSFPLVRLLIACELFSEFRHR